MFVFFCLIQISKWKSVFLQQNSRTGNFDSNLILRQYKLNLMADFMRMKYENLKMKQSEIENQLSYSTSTLQRYRKDINMLSPCRSHPNATNKRSKKVSNTNINNNSHREHDLKRPQLTSNDIKRPQANQLKIKKN